MAKAQLTYKGMVYPWHCDHVGHMNVMWYVGKFDEATWAFFGNIGLEPASMRKSQRGMAALDQHVTYKREAMPGDALEIYSKPLEVKEKIIRFFHEMIDCSTGETVATCELIAIHLDTKARKGIALPKDVGKKVLLLLENNGDTV